MSQTKLSCFAILVTLACVAQATKNYTPFVAPSAPSINANSYLLIDYNSDKILAEKNVDKLLEPASLTKMMTMYVVDHELQNGNINPNTPVLISKKAWKAPGSRMFIEVGSSVEVGELIKGIIIQSGNDASIALAEHIAGSESAFADLMNAYAKSIGMQNSHFVNVTGLPHTEHLTTARDMAILAKALIKEFPDSYKLYSEKTYTYQGIKQINRNRLLWLNEHVDGIKTGNTDNAGFCLVSSAMKDNMRLIAVVMGANTDEARTNESNKLLNWGFRFFHTKKVYAGKEPIQQMPIWMGKQRSFNVGFSQDMYITVPSAIKNRLNASITLPEVIKAPITAGDVLGSYQLQFNDEIIAKREIISLDDVGSANIWYRMLDKVKLTFNGFVENNS